MQSDAETESGRLRLPMALDFAAAEGFLNTIRDWVRAQSHLHLDASQVATLTLPCIQVLLAARQSCEQMRIERPSAEFVSAYPDLGLDCADLCSAGVAAAIDPEATRLVPDAMGDAGPPAPAEIQPVAKRILTIDDSKTIRDMLLLTLADAGFHVLQAVDGQDGLDVLGKEQVDVVITDINMPRMDGYEVIRHMRSNSAHKTTPILVLTTESETEKKNLAREAGATGWMVKPFDPDRLIATLNRVAP